MLKTYDPNLYDVIFAGVRLNEGTADGQFVQVEFNAPAFTKKVGADGTVTRARSADRSGSLTVTLMQTSAINDVLSGIHLADRSAPNGQGVGSLLIQDRAGTTVLRASKAWIADDPSVTLEMEATTREWVIDFADGYMFHGGNPLD
jgi:hypothetical protein